MSFDPPTSSDSQAYDSAQDAERVELIGSAVVSGTVDQGTGGTSAWLVNVNGVPHVILDAATIAALTDGTQRIGGTVAVSGPLTDTQLRAVAVPVSGSVSVSNFPATQPVSGTVTTSSAVANRNVAVEYRTGDGARFVLAGSAVTIPANSRQAFCWFPEAQSGWPVEDAALAALPSQWLSYGQALAITVYNGDAADLIDQVRIVLRPPRTERLT